MPSDAEKAIYGLTNTEDRSRQIDALNVLGERLRSEHLARLKPLAHDEFNAFCEYVNADEPPESPWHIWLTDTLQKIETEPGNERFVLNCPPGHGKDSTLDCPIFTPSGWTTMGEIQVGDELYDETGAVCHVTWKSPVYKDQNVYKVTTDCGDEIVCGAGHEWPVVLCRKKQRPATKRGRYKRTNPNDFTIHTTESLAKVRSKRPMIRRAGVVQSPERDLPLDPYLLGVWLGDGSKDAGTIYAHETDAAEWMRPEIERLGFKTTTHANSQSFGVLGLRTKLREIGVLNDKHIPLDYILASPAQRLALLQGLIDTDGTVANTHNKRKNGQPRATGQVTFVQKSRDLAEQVQFLVRSLGVKASLREFRASLNGKDYGVCHEVSFYHAEAARMPRKRVLCRNAERTNDTYITVEPAGIADTQCLEVSSKNHLFLIGRSMTPTHNPLDVETPIQIGDGSWKRLGSIVVGDSVITHLGNAKRVSAVHEQGTLDVLKIKTLQGREIVSAPDHSFLMREMHGPRASAPMWREAGKLRPGNALVLARAKPIANTSGYKKCKFELAAYWGASGGRTYSPDRSKTRIYHNVFLFTMGAATCLRMCGALQRARIKHHMRFDASMALYYIRLDTATGDRMSSVYGFDERADFRRIPDFVFKGGDAEVRAFIETFVAVRGEVPNRFKTARLHISFKSRAYARDFQRLLGRFAVPSRLMLTGVNAAKLILEAGAVEAYRAARLCFTPEQTKKLAPGFAFLNVKPSHTDRIAAITRAGKVECRCLTVEDDASFIAGGVVVHNSTYASRLYVAWRMGRRPREKMIGGGHSQRFVENEFSKKIRNLVGSPAYRDIFPSVVIDANTRAADQWALAGTGGQYVAKGAGQAIHGYRANFVCVDDPYPKIEAAESPTIRETVETWFFGDIGSRLLPGATVFLVMTRFHEDDLTGAVIEANKKLAVPMRYRIVEAPAICYEDEPEDDLLNRDKGDVLWDYYPLEYFDDKRATWSYPRFSLVFQQITSASSPDSIASKLKFYHHAPHASEDAIRKARDAGKIDPATGRAQIDKRDYYRRIVASVDTAAKTTERADYTVVQIWAESHDRKHYLLDQKRGKWELPQMTREINKLARRHGVDAILVEDKGQGTAYIQEQGTTKFQHRKAPAPVVAIQVNPNQGKVFRFDEITPMIEAGEVFVPERADWIDLFIREIGQFPDGAHDDQVDALSQYLRWMKTKRNRYGARKVGSLG